MRVIALAVAAFALVASFATQARAAQIYASPPEASGQVFIFIVGDLVPGDEQKFVRLALPIEIAVVVFNSNGGNLKAGIEIGRAIRLKEYSTLVSENDICASACALAWLGGNRRFLLPGARVGFHVAYVQTSGGVQETGQGNAVAGAYLNQLGLPQSAVLYVTSASPSGMRWLSKEDAQLVGIEVTILASSASPNDGSDGTAVQSPSKSEAVPAKIDQEKKSAAEPSTSTEKPDSNNQATESVKINESDRPNASKYSKRIWPDLKVRSGQRKTMKTPYGTLSCSFLTDEYNGRENEFVRFCRWQ